MLGYSIFTSGTLKFLKGDSKYHITVLNKIEQLLELSHTQGQLTDEQLFWLQYLLNLSQTNNLVKIKK